MVRGKLLKLVFLVLLLAAVLGPFGAEPVSAFGCPNYGCPITSVDCWEGTCCCFYDCGDYEFMYCFFL